MVKKLNKKGDAPFSGIKAIIAVVALAIIIILVWPKVSIAKDTLFDLLGIGDKKCESGKTTAELKKEIDQYISTKELAKKSETDALSSIQYAFGLCDKLLKCSKDDEKEFVKERYYDVLIDSLNKNKPYLALILYQEIKNKFSEERSKLREQGLARLIQQLKSVNAKVFEEKEYGPVQLNTFMFLNDELEYAINNQKTDLINSMKDPFLRYAVNLIDSPTTLVKMSASAFIEKISKQLTKEESKSILGPAVKPLIDKLSSGDGTAIAEARALLIRIGEPAIQPLIGELKYSSSPSKDSAIIILSKIGEPAVEPLINALSNSDNNVIEGAKQTLALMPEGLPKVVSLLASDNENIRKNARFIIEWGINNNPQGVSNAFADILAGDNPQFKEKIKGYINNYASKDTRSRILDNLLNNIKANNDYKSKSIAALTNLQDAGYTYDMVKIISQPGLDSSFVANVKTIIMNIGKLGSGFGEATIAQLIVALEDPTATGVAKEILVNIGKPALAQLNEKTKSSNLQVAALAQSIVSEINTKIT